MGMLTQNLSRTFQRTNLIIDSVVFLESRPTSDPSAASNLYILAGHENSY